MALDPTKASKEEIERGLKLLAQQREANKRATDRLKNDATYAAKVKADSQRAAAKDSILRRKAKEAGITVSPQEIDKYLKDKDKTAKK